jgi:hypothetical protein
MAWHPALALAGERLTRRKSFWRIGTTGWELMGIFGGFHGQDSLGSGQRGLAALNASTSQGKGVLSFSFLPFPFLSASAFTFHSFIHKLSSVSNKSSPRPNRQRGTCAQPSPVGLLFSVSLFFLIISFPHFFVYTMCIMWL